MHAILSLLSLATTASAIYRGWDLGANNPDGSCKASSDWNADFVAMKDWYDPTGENNANLTVRVYASSDCSTIANIVQPAIANGIKILAGVWTEDAAHYEAEKQALDSAVVSQGCDWLAAVSVGSEDLYRGDTDASTLAGQIYDVRGMIHQYGGSCPSVPIGHTDTWTAWVNGTNTEVITAADMLISDGYPYWQGSDISDSVSVFTQSINAVVAVAQGKEVWIGETGWPTAGANYGAAVPSVANLQAYWNGVICNQGPLSGGDINYFWYSAYDAPSAAAGVEQYFGVADSSRTLKINLAC